MTVVEPRTRAVRTCALDALPVERGVAALVADRQVALFRLADDTVHAVDHRDPISGANVLARGLLGTAGDAWYVASPLHKQRFVLTTGKCLDADTVAIAVHHVDIRDGEVFVTLTA